MTSLIFNPLSLYFTKNPNSPSLVPKPFNFTPNFLDLGCDALRSSNPRVCSSIVNAVRNGYERDVEALEREIRERMVNCEVEVISWRERRIKAEISVNSDVEAVWKALTDYERLADYIPNLVSSGRIPCPFPGRIWLEQRGFQRALYWHIEARVVLDLKEFPNSVNDRELHFFMVDGDFKKFEGKWSVKSNRRSSSTILSYEVNVIPKFTFPAIFLERIIQSDLPVNLRALACRAESSLEGHHKLPMTRNAKAATAVNSGDAVFGTVLDDKDMSGSEIKNGNPNSSLGPLPQAPSEVNCKWGILGKLCRLEKPCLVDEIHLRRFDELLENGGVHRCVVASITVKAPVREVWGVLTAYESLHEVVPNLAISKVLFRDNNKVRILQEGCKGLLYMVLHARAVLDLCEQLEQEISFEQVEGDFDAFCGKWQLEQLGSHHTLLKYSVESKMHRDTFLSEAIMEEVIYEDLPSNLCAIRDYIEKRTKTYSGEVFDQENLESQIDGTCQELPSTSSGYVSDTNHRNPVGNNSNRSTTSPTKPRPRVPGLQHDLEVLKSEILRFISEHGQEGFMPMRKQLRLHGRVDIEKAINKMGGFRRIATLMNLSLAYKHRKPKGYWDNLENLQEEDNIENLQEEINLEDHAFLITCYYARVNFCSVGDDYPFSEELGMDPSYMPSRKTFERAGRYDIARALEKWGGLHEVSRLLSLKLRHPNRQASFSIDKKNDCNSSASVEAERKGAKSYVSQDTELWLTKLRDLDITWVE